MAERIYSVGQVNTYIKRLISSDYGLRRIAIKGEVSNLKYHSSGHIYFTLKDADGAIRCVMFASSRDGLAFRMQDGQSVIVNGRMDVYERDGTYQLYASQIRLDGAGMLYQRYEELKQRLFEEGLFDFEHKQEIPRYVKKVGIVTAATGAAIRDIESIASRRNPYVQLVLYPAKVQGEGAANSIVKGIKRLDRMGMDVIIVGRGGGSIEDLWAFNEEIVARAIYDAKTPIISGTGHETDTTIADYVADKRAATPSAACELAVFDYYDFVERLQIYAQRMTNMMMRLYRERRQQLKNYELRLEQQNPGYQLELQKQMLAERKKRMSELMWGRMEYWNNRLQENKRQFQPLLPDKLQHYRHQLELRTLELNGLSPTAKLVNGYGYIAKKGIPVKEITDLQKDDVVSITMANGKKNAKIL